MSSTRVHGAAAQSRSRSISWAGKQEKLRPHEKCFFLTSIFIERHEVVPTPGWSATLMTNIGLPSPKLTDESEINVIIRRERGTITTSTVYSNERVFMHWGPALSGGGSFGPTEHIDCP